jgi:hypothetical protein
MDLVRRCGLAIVVVCVFNTTYAADSVSVVPEQHTPSSIRRVASIGLVGGSLALSGIWAFDEWWKGNASRFHFLHEGWFNDYSLGIDKVGHFYTSYFYFRMFNNILLWGEHDEDVAFWWAAGATALFAVGVEAGDGFSPYGFSYEDLTANFLGLGYAMLQARTPVLRNFTFKWSYIPDRGTNAAARFSRHYDFHTYWIACNVHELLPDAMQQYWPEFLQIALGYSVADGQTRREAVIGLDFNLEAFSTSNAELQLVQKTINAIHFPAPGMKFSEQRAPEYQLFYTN